MPQHSTHKNDLPFKAFIGELSRQGFVIGVDHHLRLQKLLNALGPDCTPSDLKYLLCPIFASSDKQQDKFHRIFERYFGTLEMKAGKKISRPPKPPEDVSELVRIPKIPYILLGVLLFALVVLIPFWWPEKEMPTTSTVTTSSVSPVTSTLPGVSVTSTSMPQVTTTIQEEPKPTNLWNRANLRWLLIAGVLIAFLLNELYIYSERRAVLQKQGVKKPPFVWTIQTPESRFLKTGQFYETARVLRQRLKGEGNRLDVKGTVIGSLKAGYPKLRYKGLTRPPEYLFLIDLRSYRDHYAYFFAHIADALKNEDIFAERYFYRENPRVCFREMGGEQFYLSDLRGKYRDCRLIMVGTCDDLLNAFSGEIDTWTKLFDAWEERAILSTEQPRNWARREATLAEKFILLPATLEGLAALPYYFENPSKLRLGHWKVADGKHPSTEEFRDVSCLREYLGPEAFQWLCACAVYTELQWGLTLYLGHSSSRGIGKSDGGGDSDLSIRTGQWRESEQKVGTEQEISEETLLRLIRLPWFREGQIPEEMRWKLIRELDEERLGVIREEIAALFEKHPPRRDSFAHSAFGLNLAVQDFVFSRKSFKDRRQLRKNLESVTESHVAQDYTLLRFLESVPKTSPLSFVLPERLRNIFYKNGLFVFGMKTGIRFALCLSLVLSMFLITAPKVPDISETKITNTIDMSFAYIPPGEFMMGSPADEPGRYDEEKQHKVTLTQGFYMQTTEVTQGQWRAVMGSDPSDFKDCGDDCPVENVSWDDVREFIRKLNEKEGGDKYRLPTEAEWEYAARAGTTTPFFFGDCLSTDQANYDGNSPLGGCPKGEYRKKTIPVASFASNAWGLYDMHGNVYEWCQDWFGDYPSGTVTDPGGPSTGSYRVLRGGGWNYVAGHCRAAFRGWLSPDRRYGYLGLRLALSPGQQGG